MADARLDLRKEAGQNSIAPKMLRRNITPMHLQMWRMVATPMGGVALMTIFTGAGLIFPAFILPAAILGALLLMFIGTRDAVRHPMLPIRLPAVDAGVHLDFNDPLPQHKGYYKARGEWFLGNTWNASREVWAAFKDAVTHSLVVGGTGAGKTEQLMSMMYAGLSCGGGSGYVDPQARPRGARPAVRGGRDGLWHHGHGVLVGPILQRGLGHHELPGPGVRRRQCRTEHRP